MAWACLRCMCRRVHFILCLRFSCCESGPQLPQLVHFLHFLSCVCPVAPTTHGWPFPRFCQLHPSQACCSLSMSSEYLQHLCWCRSLPAWLTFLSSMCVPWCSTKVLSYTIPSHDSVKSQSVKLFIFLVVSLGWHWSVHEHLSLDPCLKCWAYMSCSMYLSCATRLRPTALCCKVSHIHRLIFSSTMFSLFTFPFCLHLSLW